MNAKAGEYRRSELYSLDVTISAQYHWYVARQLIPFHYIIGISGILPYNRNLTLQKLELFSAFARLYSAAALPASRLRSAGSLAIILLCGYNRTCALIGCCSALFSCNDQAWRLFWLASKSYELMGENNKKDGQSTTIFSITERKTSI